VPLDLLQTDSLNRVAVEQPANEIDDLGRKVDGKLYLHFEDFVVGLVFVSFRLKWRLPSAQLITKHAQTPNICLLVVKLPCHYLGRHVVQSPTKSLSFAE